METKSVWKGLIFGGISASAAEIATFPIDSVKTRMQLQGELGKRSIYSNSWQATIHIARAEGVLALFKVRVGTHSACHWCYMPCHSEYGHSLAFTQ